MHHPLASCIVWDCGHGMMESMPYHDAPVWAQQEKGRPISLPVAGMKQRYAFAAYRALVGQIRLAYQQTSIIILPPGVFWRMENLAAFDGTREGVRSIASSRGFVVIEGAPIWDSNRAPINTKGSFHFHVTRNESTALAQQW